MGVTVVSQVLVPVAPRSPPAHRGSLGPRPRMKVQLFTPCPIGSCRPWVHPKWLLGFLVEGLWRGKGTQLRGRSGC